MLGIIRVLTTNDSNILEEHSRQMKAFLGVNGKTECIANQWNGIHDEQSEKEAVPKIVDLANRMINTKQYKALTISCAADPAIELLYSNSNIAIIGAGSAGPNVAKSLGTKIGVMGITSEMPESIEGVLNNNSIYRYNNNIRKTTDLFNKNAKQSLYEPANQLIEDNVDVILFACTGFSTIKLKKYLKKYTNIPIIDLIEAQSIIYKAIE